LVVKQFNSYVHLDKNTRKNVLAHHKWNGFEIEDYDSDKDYINCLEIDFLDIMVNIIEHIYTYIILRFDPSNEAKDYMNIILLEKIIFYLQNKIEKTIPDNIQTSCKKCNNDMPQQMPIKSKIDETYKELSDRLFDSIDDYMHYFFSHTLISKDLKNLIQSAVDVMGLPKVFNEQKIQEIEETSNELSEEENNKYMENIKPLKSLYELLSQRI